MPRDRDNRSKDRDEGDLPEWDLPETHLRAIGLLNEIIRMTPRNDPRLDYLLLLRHQLETDEKQLEEAQKVIAEFEEAYNKLTSPANRIGVFLGAIEKEEEPRKTSGRFLSLTPTTPPETAKVVRIALGEQEYIANV